MIVFGHSEVGYVPSVEQHHHQVQHSSNNKSTITSDRISYDVDWVHRDSITGTGSGQYVNKKNH